MPTRVIEGDIWRDEWFGTLGFMEQALWIGLFSSCADCQGRLLDNVALIRATVWPFQEVSLESINVALAGFAAERKVLRYTANGKRCIQVLRWWRYQYPRWASASKLPRPEGWQDHARTSGDKGIVENNWGDRSSRMAGEDAFLTALRDGNPLRDPVTAPSALNSDSDSDSDRKGTPDGSPSASTPEVLQSPELESLILRYTDEMMDTKNAEANISRALTLWARTELDAWGMIRAINDARKVTRDAISRHRVNGARMAYFFAVLEDRLGLREPQDTS
jgi:hypothetical protein